MCYKILPKDTESASEVSRMYHLVYCDDFLDFGYFLLEYSFDAHPHCHLGAGAALAGSPGANSDRVVVVCCYRFDIATAALLTHKNTP
jgi:hypothetical protein